MLLPHTKTLEINHKMRPKTNAHHITREELESMVIPDGSNIVIVHIPHKNEDSTTKSGIYVVGDQDFNPHLHAERWGYIYKKCRSLFYDYSVADSLPWKTEVEVEEGDKVWFDFREAAYAYTFVCEGEWYKIINYEFLRVVQKDDGEIVPLNGYILFEEYHAPRESDILLEDKKDDRYAIARYVGRPNDEYSLRVYNDDIDIYPGDHVLFEDNTSCFPLESGVHNEFSEEKFVVQQRKRILGVVDESHQEIIRHHIGVVGVKVKPPDEEVKGIKLLKDQKRYRVGVVRDSANDKIPNGSVVCVPKKASTTFNELEYFTEDRILYYETATA